VAVAGPAVSNATTGVDVAGSPTGTVRNLTLSDVPIAVDAADDASGLRFAAVELAPRRTSGAVPVEVTFNASNAAVGTVQSMPSPAIPEGRANGTGPVRVVPNGGPTEVLRFDPAAVDAGNASVYRYDPGTGSWTEVAGTPDEANGTIATSVSPATDASEIYGAFTTAEPAPPTADAGANVTAGVGESVTFDGGNSTDDRGIVSHVWALGDGTVTTGESVTHAYGSPGSYTATLTVTDADGLTDTDTRTVTVGTACPRVDGTRTHDTDDDGLCDDLTGDRKRSFLDVVALLFVDPGSLTKAERALFDFDGDGSFGFLDVVTLLFEL
jgi:hypothetical protein